MTRPKQPLSGQWLLSEQKKTIRIPVRIRTNGGIEYFYGGALPEMGDGTIGDLVVPERSITDQREVSRLQQEHVVRFLPPRSVILFAVDGTNTPAELEQHLKEAITLGMKKSHAIELTLNRIPLRLRLRGTKPAMLEGVPCWIPSLQIEAKSLNHAYRLVSERFEPSRISHSGNVFELGYFKSGDTWISLGDLRNAAVARFEMLFSRKASKVFELLSEKIGSVLRECWGGPLQTQKTLKEDFDRWQSELLEAHSEAAFVDVQETCKLLGKMLTSISENTSHEDTRLIQAAVKYLLRDRDEERSTKLLIGFDDDVLVVRIIAEELD